MLEDITLNEGIIGALFVYPGMPLLGHISEILYEKYDSFNAMMRLLNILYENRKIKEKPNVFNVRRLTRISILKYKPQEKEIYGQREQHSPKI